MQAIKRVGDEHPDYRLPSYSLAGLMMLTAEPAEAERALGDVFATGRIRVPTNSFPITCSRNWNSRSRTV